MSKRQNCTLIAVPTWPPNASQFQSGPIKQNLQRVEDGDRGPWEQEVSISPVDIRAQ